MGFTVRKTRPDDLARAVEFGVKALEVDAQPELRISRDKVHDVAQACISGPSNFFWIAEDESGDQVAGLAAVQHENTFYERHQVSVLHWFSVCPGAGVALMREFLKWARARRVIKVISVSLPSGADPRMGKLLERMGLGEGVPFYLEIRK